jgi:Tfp pilus assembly protein FimV
VLTRPPPLRRRRSGSSGSRTRANRGGAQLQQERAALAEARVTLECERLAREEAEGRLPQERAALEGAQATLKQRDEEISRLNRELIQMRTRSVPVVDG